MTFRKRISCLLACVALGAAMPMAVQAQTQPAETEARVPARSFSGAYLAAGAALTDNEYAEAAAYFQEALTYDPENTEIQRQLLISYLTDGQFEEALPVAEKLKTIPDIERVSRIVLGLDALRQGKFVEAQSLFILSSEGDLERLLSGILRGWAQTGAGNAEQGIATVQDLQGPDWYKLFVAYHAALMAEAGQLPDAARRFEDAMNDAAGGSASPLTYLRMAEHHARFLSAQGKNEEAKATLQRGLALAPTNPSLLALIADLDAGKTLEATPLDPVAGASEILVDLGSAINRDGSESFAALYLQMARAMRPDDAQTLFELGSIADRLGKTERAISYFSAIDEASPLHRPGALQQGLALANLDRNDQARETLTKLVDENPADYSGYLALGGVLAADKDFAEAARVYERALQNLDGNDARFWPLHYRLGIAYERTKEWPKAEAAFKKALELAPNQPDVLNYLGYSWIDMNINLQEGIDMIKTAVEMRPEDGYIVDSLGWAYYRLGQFDDAVRELEQATDLRSQDPTINDHLGDAYWRVDRKLEATYQWAQALDMEPEEEDAAKIKAKLDAATKGEKPAIAVSQADDPSKAKIANGKAEPAPEPQPAPAPAKDDKTETVPVVDPIIKNAAYTVKAGDSLWSIANSELGDGQRIQDILDANPQLQNNPDRIYPGMELKLP